jgi:hypothetical protein
MIAAASVNTALSARRAGYAVDVAANEDIGHELIVGADGSIPAEQLKRLGVAPGAHLRVVQTPASQRGGSFAGSLPNFPELTWEDFERASRLACEDVASS